MKMLRFYDAVATAVELQNMQMDKKRFAEEYANYWTESIMPQIIELPGWINILDVPLYETDPITGEVVVGDDGLPVYIDNAYEDWAKDMNVIIEENQDLFEAFTTQLKHT